uniref:Forkhead box Q2 n=1 Tax=Cyprinodon variegatus TaxID=28743 RepID=A0A3Q2D8B2_CYPVA
MSLEDTNSELTTETRNSHNGSRDRLGLSFTIDYLLFNSGVERSKGEVTCLQEPNAKAGKSKTSKEEWDKNQHDEGEEEKSLDKPNQSYIALISKAILASDEKKLLLCDIYQWIMDHYPYFKSKDKNWRNSVRHNLSLNDCFIKAGRSDNGKGHFWAIHPANYQDFSKGDYQCRRARRRARRAATHIRFSSLTSPHHPAAALAPHRTTCWCCPQVPTFPLSCFTPRLYWPWSSMQQQVGLQLGLNPSVP